MPRGTPKIGSRLPDSAMELTEAPMAESVGTLVANSPAKFSGWVEPDGTRVEIEEGPPPWEVAEGWRWNRTDARQFIDCPTDWELRWLSPQLLDKYGDRGWLQVRPSDSRVKVKNRAMVSVEGYVRRGGQTGDLLYYMPKHWYESKRRLQQDRTARLTQSSRDRIEKTKEEFRRKSFGRYISIDSATHPTNTLGDGSTMKDD